MTVSWSLKGDVISSEPSITTSMIGTRTSILMITSVGYRHSGQYTCTAKNTAGVEHFTTELKVNGNYSSLSRKMERERGSDGVTGLLGQAVGEVSCTDGLKFDQGGFHQTRKLGGFLSNSLVQQQQADNL